LIVTDAIGYTNTGSVFLSVIPSVLNVSIAENRTAGTSPFGVGLSVTASGGALPYQFLWDFGDGSSNSSGTTVTHTYRNGTFVTTVLVTDRNGDSSTSNVSIHATGGVSGPVVTASSVPSNGQLPLPVNFTSAETGCAHTPSYVWDFGDGQVGSGQNITHTYDETGHFVATVLASCPGQGVSEATTNVTAAWSVLGWGLFSDTYAYAPFNATAACTLGDGGVAPFDCLIDFGDGSPAARGTSTFHHIYWFAGNFPVTLTMSDGLGRNATGTATMTVLRAPLYNVTFTETGLPPGTRWSVSVAYELNLSSFGPAISMNLCNGSLYFPYNNYSYTAGSSNQDFRAMPGSFSVNGTSVNVAVAFTPVTSWVRFYETGLPNGTAWWVNVSGEPSGNSIGPQITLPLTNGTYNYSVSAANKTYHSGDGSFEVTGSLLYVSVAFSQVTYRVELVEEGLPIGTLWNVSILGATHSSLTAYINLSEPNGSYPFSIKSSTAYSPNPESGSLHVNGKNVTESIIFSKQLAGSSTFLGLPTVEGYGLVAGIVTAFALTAAILVFRSRQGKKEHVAQTEQTSTWSLPDPPT